MVKRKPPPQENEVEPIAEKMGWHQRTANSEAKVPRTGGGPGHLSENQLSYLLQA